MAKTKIYIDLSDCKDNVSIIREDDSPIIPIRPGCYFRDFDIIESKIKKKTLKRWKKAAHKQAKKQGAVIDHRMPIGFDIGKIPKGAKIIFK